jgi:hypothetical protein
MDASTVLTYYAALQIPTNSKCIRLLHVEAPLGAEGIDGPVRCSMSVHDLNTKPSYTALSYVWGTMSPTPDTVQCEGIDLPISANGLSALRHLRAKLGGCTIWIDAVCINQCDTDEKSEQIPLMGEIFQNAATTYFWLGESSPSKRRAMQYLSRAGLLQYYFKNADTLWVGGVRRRPWAAYFHYLWHSWSLKHGPVPYRYDRNGKVTIISFVRY